MSRCNAIPRLISSFRSSTPGKSPRGRQGVVNRCHPLLRYLVPRTHSVLPSSLRTPRAFALLSDPGRTSTPGLAAFRCCPRKQDDEGSNHTSLSGLNPTAFALAVYASCRPLGRRRKTRFRWLANPFRVSFFIPTEFVRRVSAVASPLPGFILARLAPDLDLALTHSRSRAGSRARGRAAERELHLRIISATTD